MGGSDEGDRPPGAVDARFTLAAERTVLAWLRTALGLVAAGVAILHIVHPFTNVAIQSAMGIGLVLLGAFAAVVGTLRWHRTNRALRDGGTLPGPAAVFVLAGVLVLFALAFAIWT